MLRTYPEPLNTILSKQIAAVMEMSEIAYKQSEKYAKATKKAEETWKKNNEEIVKKEMKESLEPLVIADIKRKIVKEKHEKQARHYEERKAISPSSVLVPSVFK
jgi:hypothetical protein